MKIHFKICGILNLDTALFCEKIGVDFLGFNFVKSSKRYINPKLAKSICQKISIAKKVGIFVNEEIDEVNEIAENLNLDLIQLHGEESNDYLESCHKPVIKAFRIKDSWPDLSIYKSTNIKYFLFDGSSNGHHFDHQFIQENKINKDFFIAGGINPDNFEKIYYKYKPYGLDIASGIETPINSGQKDKEKILQLFQKI